MYEPSCRGGRRGGPLDDRLELGASSGKRRVRRTAAASKLGDHMTRPIENHRGGVAAVGDVVRDHRSFQRSEVKPDVGVVPDK